MVIWVKTLNLTAITLDSKDYDSEDGKLFHHFQKIFDKKMVGVPIIFYLRTHNVLIVEYTGHQQISKFLIDHQWFTTFTVAVSYLTKKQVV